ncbi:formylglycine-generating enzyme family protein [Colwellia psychrerythraea]|uniref:Sulphatase-modifying factor protein n=1 Tax=Colwellia psychrerythraea TaxID=28229 RepID=A0A099KWN2_COLPS|nr:SUMF1/EgtB/PvdO family nonheme iron enzyme [Colwellia psychrerythraea]KGJ95109.1 Sulphatase-modifying factor protein [Colwellia psychrerythraea]
MNILSMIYQITRQIIFINLMILLTIGNALSQEVTISSAESSLAKSQPKKVIKLAQTKQDKSQHTLSQASQKQVLASMVWVEGGDFVMGSDNEKARNREKPAHKVSLNGFYIGKTEVTSKLWEELMGWNYSYFTCDNCAVNNISWKNVQTFFKRLNAATGKVFRLPSEAEWEYAAKGGNKSRGFTYSGSDNIDEVAWYAGNSSHRNHPVAMKKPNELGLYDMSGNLWEFCMDDMSRSIYSKAARHNPLHAPNKDFNITSMKVIRGSGYDFPANESEVYKRDGATSNVRMPDIGFRLALDSL